MTLLKLFYFGFLETFFYGDDMRRHLPMISETNIFATGKSLDCGEATSSRASFFSTDSKPRGTNMSTQHSPQNQERKNANSFRPKSRSRSRGNVSTPKENIVIFTSVSVLDANLKSAARLVHGIGIRKTSVCSKYCDKFCCRRL
ncbi:hypothetical protein TNCV_597641 [Trichonephila clavipes]|nr:hypothetical protein TNCV_597641 [Trichonephila clavipes]